MSSPKAAKKRTHYKTLARGTRRLSFAEASCSAVVLHSFGMEAPRTALEQAGSLFHVSGSYFSTGFSNAEVTGRPQKFSGTGTPNSQRAVAAES